MIKKIELIRAETLDPALRGKEGLTISDGTIGLELSSGSVNRKYTEIKGKFFDFLRSNVKKDGKPQRE